MPSAQKSALHIPSRKAEIGGTHISVHIWLIWRRANTIEPRLPDYQTTRLPRGLSMSTGTMQAAPLQNAESLQGRASLLSIATMSNVSVRLLPSDLSPQMGVHESSVLVSPSTTTLIYSPHIVLPPTSHCSPILFRIASMSFSFKHILCRSPISPVFLSE